LSILKDNKFINYNSTNGLPNDRVESLLKDANGSLWIGTYGGGIAKKTGDAFEIIQLGENVNSKIITCLLNDREGNFWVGTWMGIYKYDNNRFVTYNAEDGLPSNNILSVYYDSNGSQVLLGTLAGGLNIIKNGKVLSTTLSSNSVLVD